MRKIIFLDIDGVFNCEEWYKKRLTLKNLPEHPLSEFCPKRIKLFNKLIDATNADIVISSTWRADGKEAMCDLFKKLGIKGNIVGITPHMGKVGMFGIKNNSYNLSIPRGCEIQWWIDSHLIYPWYAYPERSEEWTDRKEDGSFKMMKSGRKLVDYNYCIIDDDPDMLYSN